MTREDFQVQLQRLVETFGKAAYSNERCAMIWREVQNLSGEWMRTTVDAFLSSARQAPLAGEFRDAAWSERDRMAIAQVEPEPDWGSSPRCEFCNDRGVYCATKNGTDALYAFRCHCTRGMNDSRVHIPQFKAEHAKQFTWADMTKRQNRASLSIVE